MQLKVVLFLYHPKSLKEGKGKAKSFTAPVK